MSKLVTQYQHIYQKSFENLDELITRLMHTSDKNCRSKITDQVKWSPKYKEEMDLVELWVLLKTRYEEHHYNRQQITQLQRQYPQVTLNVN